MKPVIVTAIVIDAIVSFIVGILSIFFSGSYGFVYILFSSFFNFIIPTLIVVLLYKYIILKTRFNSTNILIKSLLLFGIQSAALLIWIILDVMTYYSFNIEACSNIENFKEHVDHEFIGGFIIAFIYSLLIPSIMPYFSRMGNDIKDVEK